MKRKISAIENQSRLQSRDKIASTVKSINLSTHHVTRRKKQPTQATTQTGTWKTRWRLHDLYPFAQVVDDIRSLLFPPSPLSIPDPQTEISLVRPRISSWGCITWNVRSLLSRSHCTPLMGRVWYGDNMTHLRVIVEPDGTLCSRGPIMSATGAVLS